MPTLEGVFRQPIEILAVPERDCKPATTSGRVDNTTANKTAWPIGFPRGLVVTNSGGDENFDPYLTTPLNVPLGGTWTDDTDVDSSDITDDTIDGTLAKKFTVAAAHAAGDLIATQVVTSTDYSGSDFAILYIKPSVDVAAGDLQIGMSATVTLGGSPVFDDIPALKANVWNIVPIATASLPSATISVGFKAITDLGAYNFTVGYWEMFTADSSNAAVGVLKEDVSFDKEINQDVGTDTKCEVYLSGEFDKTKLLGLDSGAITDVSGRTLSNGHFVF